MRKKLQQIRAFLKENGATCVDISEEYIFNCPPDICEGYYLTGIFITPKGLRFEGQSWNDNSMKFIPENEISDKEVKEILDFINNNQEYIKENALFS